MEAGAERAAIHGDSRCRAVMVIAVGRCHDTYLPVGRSALDVHALVGRAPTPYAGRRAAGKRGRGVLAHAHRSAHAATHGRPAGAPVCVARRKPGHHHCVRLQACGASHHSGTHRLDPPRDTRARRRAPARGQLGQVRRTAVGRRTSSASAGRSAFCTPTSARAPHSRGKPASFLAPGRRVGRLMAGRELYVTPAEFDRHAGAVAELWPTSRPRSSPERGSRAWRPRCGPRGTRALQIGVSGDCLRG